MGSAALSSSPATKVHVIPKPSLAYGKAAVLSLVLALVTTLLYLPIIHHPFTNIDDQGYVYENLHVQDGLTWDAIQWAVRTFDDNNWHPLTWLSIEFDCQRFGIDPAGHHAMNIFYHALDGVVLFWVLLLATGYMGRSFMVAALFALHPINVESVAWAAERKTVLSTLFFLLALGAYRWYTRRPGIARYTVVAALFALGLMAKPQIITLPFVLLLWDYWPLERIAVRPWRFAFRQSESSKTSGEERKANGEKRFLWLLLEKVPLFLLCAASALITLKAQRVGHPQSWQYSVWIRLGNCMVAYVRYIGKALWPSHLAVMYLHPGNSLRFWHVAICGAVLLALTAMVIRLRRYRYLPVGWFWFLGTLVPTIGLLQVGRQAMADRYAYQSFLGLFILICWGFADWARHAHLPNAALPAVSVAALLVLAFLTHRQIGYWQDNMTLWTHAAQVTDNNWMAEDMVAGLLTRQGRQDDAIVHYRRASAINPDDPVSDLFIAIYEQNHGNLPEAVRHYKSAIKGLSDPLEQAKAYQNLSVAYRDLGDVTDSVECLRRAKWLRKQ